MLSKLKTLIRDPWGSVTRRSQHTLYSYRARRFWQQQPELSDFLGSRPAEAIVPDYADLWFLYRAVRERRPAVILEFGSGCSTLAMALALHHNRTQSEPGGQLLSLDSMEKWTEATLEGMPDHLRSYCDIRFSPVEETRWDSTPCFRHRGVPDIRPNLVYLDGPALTPECRVAVDPLDLEDRFPPDFLLVVDGRWENTMFLRRHFKRQYRFEYRTLFQNSTFELVSGSEGQS